MSETITPKKGLGKRKVGEIGRLQAFMTQKSLEPIDIQKETGVSARTVTHSLYEEKPLGAKLLRALHQYYGVSIDWLVSGNGSMFLFKDGQIEESPADYETKHFKTHTSKDQRVLTFLDDWMTYASDDEKTWLEMQLKFNIDAYRRHLEIEND